ncbi:MAG: threonine ammonia-lyase [Thaumarchaeota archaeon]|nr:threonine ammonia-lyase [Nitrososphaerota archaeon]
MPKGGVSLAEIREAKRILRGVIRKTPLDRSRTFSEMTSSELYLKLENLQKTGSFKTRGAYVKIHSLNREQRGKGVVAASAGNHAQGVAYSALLLKTKATIVMPEHASPAKIDATKGYGAKLVLEGRTFDDSLRRAIEISQEEGSTLVHAFDDPKVVAGQGTIGLELLETEPGLEMIVVPVGGGGLISGIAVAAKSTNPRLKVVGVQSKAFPAVHEALRTGKVKLIQTGDTIADGIAVRGPGKLTFQLIEKYVDDVVLVDDDEIAKAILLLLERAKVVVEPAGAVGLAAILSGRIKVKGIKCAVVLSGGNIDMYTLDKIVAKGLEKEGRLLRLRFTLADRPGALREIIDALAEVNANVVDVRHERMGSDVPLGRAAVVVSVETQNPRHTQKLLTRLARADIRYQRLG